MSEFMNIPGKPSSAEEAMWMGIWNQLQEDKMKPASQREIK
jgi:hypothetical protein